MQSGREAKSFVPVGVSCIWIEGQKIFCENTYPFQ